MKKAQAMTEFAIIAPAFTILILLTAAVLSLTVASYYSMLVFYRLGNGITNPAEPFPSLVTARIDTPEGTLPPPDTFNLSLPLHCQQFRQDCWGFYLPRGTYGIHMIELFYEKRIIRMSFNAINTDWGTLTLVVERQ